MGSRVSSDRFDCAGLLSSVSKSQKARGPACAAVFLLGFRDQEQADRTGLHRAHCTAKYSTVQYTESRAQERTGLPWLALQDRRISRAAAMLCRWDVLRAAGVPLLLLRAREREDQECCEKRPWAESFMCFLTVQAVASYRISLRRAQSSRVPQWTGGKGQKQARTRMANPSGDATRPLSCLNGRCEKARNLVLQYQSVSVLPLFLEC